MRGGSAGVPVAIGVASGESKVRPILGALRAGVVRTLVTDVATAEAVVALDEATLAPAREAATMTRTANGDPGHRPRDERGQGRAGRRSTGELLALARSGYGLDVSGGHGWAEQDPGAWWSAVGQRRSSAPRLRHRPRSSRSASTATVRRSSRSTRAARRRVRRSRSSTRARRAEADELECGDRHPWLGARRAAGRAVGRAARAGRRGRDLLVSLDLGVARVPAGGRGCRAARPGPGRPGPGASSPRAGVPVDRLPPTGVPGTVVGELTDAAADALGLRPGIPVAGGMVDAFASYVGAGLLEPGDAYDPGGSAGGFGVYWDRPVEVAGRVRDARRRWPAGTASGRRWRRRAGRSTGTATSILGGTISMEALLAEAAATPPGADGLVFLPYLAGERSPIWDPEARGVLAGLTLGHGRGHVARAIVEASALAIRHVARADARRRRARDARCASAAARPGATFWNQVKADVTGFRSRCRRVLETAVLGSAILGRRRRSARTATFRRPSRR